MPADPSSRPVDDPPSSSPWAGEPAAPPQATPVSIAGSHVSVGSVLRRRQAEEEYEQQRRERLASFMAQEDNLKQDLEAKLSLADAASEAQQVHPPAGSAVATESEVIRRRIASLEHERDALARVLSSRAVDGISHKFDQPISVAPLVKLAALGVKVKQDKPKPWAGKYDWQEREAWIRSALLYLSSLEIDLSALIGEELTPSVFYIVRSLFSADSTNSTLSPLAWFDSRNRRLPFTSVQDVFKALRTHWVDDHAAEQALIRYRAARQGALRARDFGAALDALADACIDRSIDDLDRRTTFIQGLQPATADFVKTQLAARKALGKLDETFEEVVKIAALTDGLASFAPPKKTPSSLSPAPKKPAYEASSPKTASPTTAPRSASAWVDSAVAWQSENTLADRARWQDTAGRPSPKTIRCYNCGKLGTHFSRACTAARRDPKGIVIAAVSKMSTLTQSPSPPSPSPSIASENRFEPLAEDAGKESKA